MVREASRTRTFAGLGAEVAFAVLPLLVVIMVLLHADRSASIFASPEWSFGAAILLGQALVKFVSGLTRGGSASTGPVALVVALLIVFGLVPALMVLFMTLQAAEEHLEPSGWLQFSQVALFAVASIAYIILGAVGESWRKP